MRCPLLGGDAWDFISKFEILLVALFTSVRHKEVLDAFSSSILWIIDCSGLQGVSFMGEDELHGKETLPLFELLLLLFFIGIFISLNINM